MSEVFLGDFTTDFLKLNQRELNSTLQESKLRYDNLMINQISFNNLDIMMSTGCLILLLF